VQGLLYIVATPIGNLKDISLRAIETLKNVDLIACEDTRHTKILLDEHGIKTSTTSYHKYNIKAKIKYIINQLKQGKNIAIVSDAGTPGISDPGQELIRAASSEKIKIEVIPGASAVICALSASGLSTDRFVFEGFLSTKSLKRKEQLQLLSGEDRTIVIYEAPHRLLRTLEDMKTYMGDRNIAVMRELTKKFEEISRGNISEMIAKFTKIRPKGEFVVVIEGNGSNRTQLKDPQLLVLDLVKSGISQRDAVKIISSRLKVSKNELYRASLNSVK